MRLIDAIRSSGPLISRLSRVRIEPAPGRCAVTLHYAGFAGGDYRDLETGAPIGPGSQQPPVTIMERYALPDTQAQIAAADLPAQIAELEESGIVGGLNVERLGDGWVISTHAATQQERTEWLLGLSNAAPDNVRPIR